MSVSEEPGSINAAIHTVRIVIAAQLIVPLVVLAATLFDPQPVADQRLQLGGPVAAQGRAPARLPIATGFAYLMAAMVVPLALVIPRMYTNWACKAIADGTWLSSAPRSARDLNLKGLLDILGRMRFEINKGTRSTRDPKSMSDVEKLALVYQHSAISGAMMLAAAALAAALSYYVERKPAALGLTILLVLGVAARFPRRAAVEHWIDGKLQWLARRRTRAL